MDTIARIRREFFTRGRAIKDIVRDLHVSRNTVRKVIRSGATAFTYERDVQPLPKLGPWRDDLDRMLATNAAMTEEQIADAIEGFATSAARAVAAGFDGIEIHGANGYLIDQFLTNYANRRDDRWGGDTRRRTTLVRAVFDAVRATVRAGVPVGVRISQGKVNDFGHKWAGREQDAEAIFGTLAETGASYLHVTEHKVWEPAFEGGRDSLVALARRYAPHVTLIANGGVQDAARAQEVMAAGADIVALGKAALANPDFPNRVRAEREVTAFDPAILGPIANIKPSELAA